MRGWQHLAYPAARASTRIQQEYHHARNAVRASTGLPREQPLNHRARPAASVCIPRWRPHPLRHHACSANGARIPVQLLLRRRQHVSSVVSASIRMCGAPPQRPHVCRALSASFLWTLEIMILDCVSVACQIDTGHSKVLLHVSIARREPTPVTRALLKVIRTARHAHRACTRRQQTPFRASRATLANSSSAPARRTARPVRRACTRMSLVHPVAASAATARRASSPPLRRRCARTVLPAATVRSLRRRHAFCATICRGPAGCTRPFRA